jgi:hypothetical protein
MVFVFSTLVIPGDAGKFDRNFRQHKTGHSSAIFIALAEFPVMLSITYAVPMKSPQPARHARSLANP